MPLPSVHLLPLIPPQRAYCFWTAHFGQSKDSRPTCLGSNPPGPATSRLFNARLLYHCFPSIKWDNSRSTLARKASHPIPLKVLLWGALLADSPQQPHLQIQAKAPQLLPDPWPPQTIWNLGLPTNAAKVSPGYTTVWSSSSQSFLLPPLLFQVSALYSDWGFPTCSYFHIFLLSSVDVSPINLLHVSFHLLLWRWELVQAPIS